VNGIERKSDGMGIDYRVASLLMWYLGDLSLIFFQNMVSKNDQPRTLSFVKKAARREYATLTPFEINSMLVHCSFVVGASSRYIAKGGVHNKKVAPLCTIFEANCSATHHDREL
jgi:hypothetical protein